MHSLLLAAALLFPPQLSDLPFYPGGTYDPAVPTPAAELGYEIGERFTLYSNIEDYYEALVDATDRMQMVPYGRTYEGRTLYTLIFSSRANLQRLDAIKADIASLRDPRITREADARAIAANTPAIAWLAYNVHGNEAASSEAAMQVAYQLAAGTDPATLDLLDELVVIIDPMINPDGRERYASHVNRFVVADANPDPNAIERREPWPAGRTNHYLFDLNRDWAWQTQVESQGRISTYLEWNPQVLVDYHEMGSNSTYFFPPPYAPINRNFPEVLTKWFEIYGQGNAEAMDRIGSRYFTAEGYDLFYPSYGDSWPSFHGAIGMTYEQAGSGFGALAIARADGTTLTLRDRALNHFTTSIATLKTTADNREERLMDFYRYFVESVERGRSGAIKQYFLVPGKDVRLARELAELLASQGIEVTVAQSEFEATNLDELAEGHVGATALPAGTYVIDLAQPSGILAHALLEPDPEIEDYFFYDITSWSLPLAYGVQAFAAANRATVSSVALADAPEPVTPGAPGRRARAAYGFTMDTNDAARMLNQVLRADIRTTVILQDFRMNDTQFPRGTIIIPVEGNDDTIHTTLAGLADEHHVEVHAFDSYLTEDGIDFGSNRVRTVQKPRVAIITDNPTSAYGYGTLWHLFEQENDIRFTAIRTSELGGVDLEDYNVIVFPDGGNYMNAVGEGTRTRLRSWIQGGGTFLGIGAGAVFATKNQAGFASIGYHLVSNSGEAGRAARDGDEELGAQEEPSEEERVRRLLTPYEEREDDQLTDEIPGATMKLRVDVSHPLAIGYGNSVALLNQDSVILELTEEGDNVVYYPESDFRVGGFMRDDKESKLAHSAYLVRERLGSGSVVLYADMPAFRSFWEGGTRLLLNGIFFGVVRDPNIE